MRYRVTWGERSEVVEADTEREAWSAFCDRTKATQKFPKLHERKIEVVKDVAVFDYPIKVTTQRDVPESVIEPVVKKAVNTWQRAPKTSKQG
jgi:hypothetical protein